MSVPHSNAELLRVLPGTGRTGASDDWDSDVAGSEPPDAAAKWTGPTGVYYRERVDRVTGDGSLDVTTRFVLYLETAVAVASGLDTDDVLVLRLNDGTERRARATAVAIRRVPGVPPELVTARVELDLLT